MELGYLRVTNRCLWNIHYFEWFLQALSTRLYKMYWIEFLYGVHFFFMFSQKQDFTSWFTVNDPVMNSWLSISLIHKYLVIFPCLFLPLFVSYSKYDFANDDSLEKTQLPNQKYIWVNKMVIINVSQKWNRKYVQRTRFTRFDRENRGRTSEIYSIIFCTTGKLPEKKTKFFWMEIIAGREAGIAAC